MAKTKDTPLTLDEENEQKAKYAGMLKKDILQADDAIAEQQSESAELSSELGSAMKLFKKQGGRKDSMRLAAKCKRMEPADFADFFRAFMGYGTALGIFGDDGKPSQLDMLEQQEEQQKNADSITAANAKVATAKPAMGKEVTH